MWEEVCMRTGEDGRFCFVGDFLSVSLTGVRNVFGEVVEGSRG